MRKQATLKELCYEYSEDDLDLEQTEWHAADCLVKIFDVYAIGFAEWKDTNFNKYKDNTYYANTSSRYFDITKYVGKEKPTVYCTIQSLMEIYKKEKGL
jgi:hypothetical protein